jgi:D-alanyl-D-alanine carboxypeptidase
MVECFGAGRLGRSWIGRFVLVFITAISMFGATAGNALSVESLREYAGIVVDAKSGEVLYEHEADAKRYPASIAKVMTLYILFQELEAGNVQLTDRMQVSKHAAAAVPTKLGLKPGWTITVSDAMKSLVTLSANDMARVIAEHISGSEEQFAKRMTATARALGMSRTTYRNASGLPDAAQLTTARDQTKLGIAIQQHFPQYYDLFQTDSFSYGERSYSNHNRLLGSNGVDGIKTGYTKTSGFNLLTVARKDHRQLVVAAIGFNTAAARDAKVRELVKTHFTSGRKGSTLETAMIPEPGRKGTIYVAAVDPVTPKPYPEFRREAAMQLAGVADQPATAAVDAANMLGNDTAKNSVSPDDQPGEVVAAWVDESYSLNATEAAPAETVVSAAVIPAAGSGEGDRVEASDIAADADGPAASASTPATSRVATAPTSVPTPEGRQRQQDWVVQIGASPSKQGADALLEEASGQVSQLQDLRGYVESFERDGQTFYRARFAGFAAPEDATGMCKRLIETKLSCLALQN